MRRKEEFFKKSRQVKRQNMFFHGQENDKIVHCGYFNMLTGGIMNKTFLGFFGVKSMF